MSFDRRQAYGLEDVGFASSVAPDEQVRASESQGQVLEGFEPGNFQFPQHSWLPLAALPRRTRSAKADVPVRRIFGIAPRTRI